jgi:hypothetical protein
MGVSPTGCWDSGRLALLEKAFETLGSLVFGFILSKRWFNDTKGPTPGPFFLGAPVLPYLQPARSEGVFTHVYPPR